jgi:hypothetical protein
MRMNLHEWTHSNLAIYKSMQWATTNNLLTGKHLIRIKRAQRALTARASRLTPPMSHSPSLHWISTDTKRDPPPSHFRLHAEASLWRIAQATGASTGQSTHQKPITRDNISELQRAPVSSVSWRADRCVRGSAGRLARP